MTAIADVFGDLATLREQRPSFFYVAGRTDWPDERRMQLQFHRSRHKIRCLAPGNGAGKTTAAGVELDWWIQHDHPYQPIPDHFILSAWICLKYQQMDILRQQLEEMCLTAGWKWNDQKHCYEWPGKGRCYVISSDGDWASIQGVPLDLCMIDEECDPRLWRELQMRRRGKRKTRFCITATATQGLRWIHQDLYRPWLEHHAAMGLDEEQAMLQQRHPTIFMWPRGGIEDNPGADADDVRHYLEEVAYGSPAEKAVRTRGGFLDFNAQPVFDPEPLDWMSRTVARAGRRGIFQAAQPSAVATWRPPYLFLPFANASYQGGRITLYEQPRPDAEYAIGSDHAYGLQTSPSSDYDAAVVLRRSEPHHGDPKGVRFVQVAEAQGKWGDRLFANVLLWLGRYFNDALICGERQYGLPCLRRLYDELGYTRLYYQRQEGRRGRSITDTLGHAATAGDVTISLLQRLLAPVDEAGERQPPQIHLVSRHTLDEVRRYQYRPRSSRKEMSAARDADLTMGAPEGHHDDLVRATGLAVLAGVELPRYAKQGPVYVPGTAGDVLGHAEALREDKPSAARAFRHAKRATSRGKP